MLRTCESVYVIRISRNAGCQNLRAAELEVLHDGADLLKPLWISVLVITAFFSNCQEGLFLKQHNLRSADSVHERA
eukprot:m.35529 g.35529  ORF g.35529 m.35529 type:complete len:76 (-) comp10030_c0_seq1:582-809(-)